MPKSTPKVTSGAMLPMKPHKPPSKKCARLLKVIKDIEAKGTSRLPKWKKLKPLLEGARNSLTGVDNQWTNVDARYILRAILHHYYVEASQDGLTGPIEQVAVPVTSREILDREEQFEEDRHADYTAVQDNEAIPIYDVPEHPRNLIKVGEEYFPWYLLPFRYKGQDQDPFEDQRAMYQQWVSAPKSSGVKADIFWSLCAENPAFFIHHVLTILDSAGVEKKFDRWFGHQKLIWQAFATQWYSTQIVRIICLKPRQVGLTTVISAFDYWFTLFIDNAKAVVMSNSSDSSKDIIERCSNFAARVDRLWKPEATKPVLNKDNTEGITYELDKRKKDQVGVVRNSSLKCKTAKSQTSPRGWVIQWLHCSEVIDWGNNGHETWTALYQSVHTIPGTCAILESTGAPGSFMEDLWKKSEKGENEFDPVFISWKEMEEYATPLPGTAEEFIAVMDETEKDLQSRGFTNEQLNWRRTIGIPSKCNGDRSKFCQEFPSTPSESFLANASTIYDPQTVELLTIKINTTIWGQILAIGNYEYQNFQHSFIPRTDGVTTIWESPVNEARYIIGIDPSKGLAGDYFSVQVFRYDEQDGLIQVAHSKHNENPRLMIEQAYCLALAYNGAFIIHESNKDDLLIQTLVEFYGYENIFREEKNQIGYRVATLKYGYYNNGPTKEELLRKGKDWFDKGKLQLRHLDTVKQFGYMVKNPDAYHKYGPARRTDHDDDHMAAVLCVEGATSKQFLDLTPVSRTPKSKSSPVVTHDQHGRYLDLNDKPGLQYHWDNDMGSVDA